jgi:hypothetical protein
MLTADEDSDGYYRPLAPNKSNHFDVNIQLPTYSLGSYIGIEKSNRII